MHTALILLALRYATLTKMQCSFEKDAVVASQVQVTYRTTSMQCVSCATLNNLATLLRLCVAPRTIVAG